MKKTVNVIAEDRLSPASALAVAAGRIVVAQGQNLSSIMYNF